MIPVTLWKYGSPKTSYEISSLDSTKLTCLSNNSDKFLTKLKGIALDC